MKSVLINTKVKKFVMDFISLVYSANENNEI